MEIRVLRYFMEVAKEENITRAALQLHVTQPTLSRQLKALEDELGKKLFIRSNHHIRLTDEGRLLYRRAADILDMVNQTTAEFEAMDDVTMGDIYIGCAESDSIRYLAQAAQAIQKEHPHIRLHLYSGNYEEVIERLDKGLLDFVILVHEPDTTKYNQLQLPTRDVWGLIMRKDSPLTVKSSITLEDMMGVPLIFSRQSLQDEMPRWFGDHIHQLNIVATYDLLFNASVFVREGVGYALGFDKLVHTGSDSVLCFRPLNPKLESSLYFIWRKHQVFTYAARLLLEEMQKEG